MPLGKKTLLYCAEFAFEDVILQTADKLSWIV